MLFILFFLCMICMCQGINKFSEYLKLDLSTVTLCSIMLNILVS